MTRYALKPAEGVKLSRIVALQNDLGLALAAHPLRIEAPIPGKSLVGIEVPNTTPILVGLAGLLSAKEYQSSEKSLIFALGKSISGKSFYGDLAKLPHADRRRDGFRKVGVHTCDCHVASLSQLSRHAPLHHDRPEARGVPPSTTKPPICSRRSLPT